MNQSVSVHWSASSWLMWSSSLHPQHDTSTVFSVLGAWFSSPYILSTLISFFILFFLSLTEDSLTENPVDCKLYFHLFSLFFVWLSCYIQRSWHGSCQLTGTPPPPDDPRFFRKIGTPSPLLRRWGPFFNIPYVFNSFQFIFKSKKKPNPTQPYAKHPGWEMNECGEIFT